MIRQIETGERLRDSHDNEMTNLRTELAKLLAKIIFADKEYTSEEIMRELKEFDYRVNLMLNE